MPYVFAEMYKKINQFVTGLPLDVLQQAMERHTVATFISDTQHLLEHDTLPLKAPIPRSQVISL